MTCSALPRAIDSRRAKACDRLVPDGAGKERRRCDRHRRPARPRLYRCLCPAGSKPSPARCASWSTPPSRRSPMPSSAPTAPASSWRAAFRYDRGHRPAPRGDHHRRPCQQDGPHRGHPVRRSSHRTRADRLVPADRRQRPGRRLARAQAANGPAVTEFGSLPGDRVRVDTVPGVSDIVLTSRLLKGA